MSVTSKDAVLNAFAKILFNGLTKCIIRYNNFEQLPIF